MKKILILFFFSCIFLFISCQEEDAEKLAFPQTTNELGTTFIQQLKNSKDWQIKWQKILDNGSPIINCLSVGSSTDFGIYYFVPLSNTSQIVDKFALFPLEFTSSNGQCFISLDEATIIDEKTFEGNQSQLSLFPLDIFAQLADNNIPIENFYSTLTNGCKTKSLLKPVRVYKVFFHKEGKNAPPWREDKSYLNRFLTAYTTTCNQWPDHNILIDDDCITISFLKMRDNNHELTDKLVSEFIASIRIYLKEVTIVPKPSYFNFTEEEQPQVNNPRGIFMLKNRQPVSLYLYLNSGGDSEDPSKYESSEGDVFARKKIPPTMKKQLPNTCVTSSMEYINRIFGGNVNEGKYIQSYYSMSRQNALLDGIAFNHVYPFVNQHFHTKLGLDYKTSIDRGMVVMTDLFNKDSIHAVVVVGYNTSKNTYIYMDPEKGYLCQGGESDLGTQFVVIISGNK